jgi:hypothetical protein
MAQKQDGYGIYWRKRSRKLGQNSEADEAIIKKIIVYSPSRFLSLNSGIKYVIPRRAENKDYLIRSLSPIGSL